MDLVAQHDEETMSDLGRSGLLRGEGLEFVACGVVGQEVIDCCVEQGRHPEEEDLHQEGPVELDLGGRISGHYGGPVCLGMS